MKNIFTLRRRSRRLPDETLRLRIEEKLAKYKEQGPFENSQHSVFEDDDDKGPSNEGLHVREVQYEQLTMEDRRLVSVAFGHGINVAELINPDPWKGNDD